MVEFAVAVADDYQGRGLGTLLMGLIALDASRHGYHSMIGLIRPGNEAMLQVLHDLGAEDLGMRDGSIELLLPLDDLATWPESGMVQRFRRELPGWPSATPTDEERGE